MAEVDQTVVEEEEAEEEETQITTQPAHQDRGQRTHLFLQYEQFTLEVVCPLSSRRINNPVIKSKASSQICLPVETTLAA